MLLGELRVLPLLRKNGREGRRVRGERVMRGAIIGLALLTGSARSASSQDSSFTPTWSLQGGAAGISPDSLAYLRADSAIGRVKVLADGPTKPFCWTNKKMMRKMARALEQPAETLAIVACGAFWVGMPRSFLFWHYPQAESVNRTTTANGTSEQWVFRDGRRWAYVYVEEQKVTAIQD